MVNATFTIPGIGKKVIFSGTSVISAKTMIFLLFHAFFVIAIERKLTLQLAFYFYGL